MDGPTRSSARRQSMRDPRLHLHQVRSAAGREAGVALGRLLPQSHLRGPRLPPLDAAWDTPAAPRHALAYASPHHPPPPGAPAPPARLRFRVARHRQRYKKPIKCKGRAAARPRCGGRKKPPQRRTASEAGPDFPWTLAEVYPKLFTQVMNTRNPVYDGPDAHELAVAAWHRTTVGHFRLVPSTRAQRRARAAYWRKKGGGRRPPPPPSQPPPTPPTPIQPRG
jgi:hypothetical protein